jgi:pyruvate formate lyase activating enzyme
MSPKREIILVESRCLGCGECRKTCRYLVEAKSQGALLLPNGTCRLCGACVEVCPTQARQIVGQPMTVAEVVGEVEKDRIFYDDSAGGVTFSGGEPLLQPQFLQALLQACRDRGIHTAVDTCGYTSPENVLGIAPITDLFLYDLKFMDDETHRRYTGVSNAFVLENLKSLGRVHNHIWIRVPLIPGLNDTDDQLEALARFAASIPGVRQVNLLPYHKTGLQKYPRLGQSFRLEGLQPPSRERIENAARKFRAFGLATKAGG